MDCIVHGVTKSQTRLSDFHKVRPRKIPQVIQAVTDHAVEKAQIHSGSPNCRLISHKPPVVKRSPKWISCFFPRDYPAPWVSSVFVPTLPQCVALVCMARSGSHLCLFLVREPERKTGSCF